ncbi:energy transducer TonB [Mucilaginibacter sp. UR6-1]|uniref:energy transducer TonB n=1 Tax=Mucilaginibacter sp. UR6-1 TaxID=1435643 RepID=UPI001E3980B8|nr:energy transducer TonB [Mucilaginibacter sp. UR6-1]MCC8410406.1 energy transducer TonB [Mucilaginibacter sp. UR6-1]
MKPIYIFIIITLTCFACYGQQTTDTTSLQIAIDQDIPPKFKGGLRGFYSYIAKNLKYPEVAQLIGISGKLKMQFIVEKDGSIIEALPVNCIGAGCEAEASKVLINSPKWNPGLQNGKAVRVQYTIPINFNISKALISMKELRKSDYGFLFLIKDKEYSIDQAEEVLGKEFLSNSIIIAEEQHDEEHKVAGKKATYLLKIDG